MEKILEEFNKLDPGDKKVYIDDILPKFKTKRGAQFRNEFDKKYKQIIENTPLAFKPGEDKSQKIDEIIELLNKQNSPNPVVTLRKESISLPKVQPSPSVVSSTNPLAVVSTKKPNLEEEKLDKDKILKYQLNVDQIIYSKDSSDLKKKQLMEVIINLKKEIKKFIDEKTIDKYKEEIKKKLQKKEGYDIELIINLFSPLINEYFESLNTINKLIPSDIKLTGGLNISYLDSPEIQSKYSDELTNAKDLQKILKNLEKEKNKQIEIEKKINFKIVAINDAYKKNIALGDRIIYTKKITLEEIKQTGTVKDINYIPATNYTRYIVELLITNEFNQEQKENLSTCKLLTSAEEEEEKKKLDLIEEKTDFLSKQVARQYGFKIGDPIDCTTKDGKNISGIAKKFFYNLSKRKTYILIKEKNKAENEKLTQIDVKYCANQYDFTLKNINKKKEREYMKKQFSKLQEIIKKINKLSPNNENYEFIIKNLTYEYDVIESQINNTMQSVSDSSSNCSEEDEECKTKVSPKDNPDVRLSNTEDRRLEDVRQQRIALLQLLQKIKPDEYLKLNTILRNRVKGPSLDAPNVGVSIGGKNTYAAKLNQSNIKFKNGKLPILNTVKGGYNTFGLTQKYMQRAGNPDENISDIINNSNNLLSIMDKTLNN